MSKKDLKAICKSKKSFFSIRDIDSHYFVQLFKLIQISFKHKCRFKYTPATSYGLTTEKRNPMVIVSLTSFPKRMAAVEKTINTLLQQTVKPDKLILWLEESKFPQKEKNIPSSLLKLKDYGLEIMWCEDLRSYCKLVPSLRMFPNDIIVTADDDIYYPKDWLESIYKAHLENPDCIISRRVCHADMIDGRFTMGRVNDSILNDYIEPTYFNKIMGVSGVLYPPNCLHKDVYNTEKFKSTVPTHDDVYFWAMAVLKGTKVRALSNKYDLNLYTVPGSEDSGLCKTNNKTKGMSPDEAFDIMFKTYPEVWETLVANK